jgi:hypothetical protein
MPVPTMLIHGEYDDVADLDGLLPFFQQLPNPYKPMVLVFDKPSNNISILQTKFSDRERHKARRIGLEAVPLDEHIESGHGER